MPHVSIIIPAHDRAGELVETLDSLRAQTLADWDAIVVDDASTEDVAGVVAAADDDRIGYVKLPADRRGAPAARNYGADHTGGEYVIFLDSDDLLSPDCLGRRVAFMESRPELDFGVWKARMFRRAAGDLPHLWNDWEPGDEAGDLDRYLAADVVWQTAGPMWRREALKIVGPWDEQLLSGQDREQHLRACVRAAEGRLRYEKRPEIDHHWRRPDGDRDSIGKNVAMDRRHPQNRPAMLRRMLAEVRDAGLLTPRRRRLLGGQFFLAAEQLRRRVSRREARQLWSEARRLGLVSLRRYAEAWPYFAARDEVLAAKLKRDLIRKWPTDLLPAKGRRYLATRAPDAPPVRISVVMPLYNVARYVEEAVESVRRQTLPDFELICVDDGSTDGTGEILEELARDDGRIRVIRQANAGLAAALNRGCAAATGEFIARMDGDDVCVGERFARQVAFLDQHPEVVCVGTRLWYIDPAGTYWGEGEHPTRHAEIDAKLLAGWGGAIQHPTAMIRRGAFERVGGYSDRYPRFCEDLDLFLRLAEVGRLANLPEKLLLYRIHPQSTTVRHHKELCELVPRAVREAYARRGVEMPADWHYEPWTPRPAAEQLMQWGWRALKDGKLPHARRFALQAWRSRPTSIDTLRLLACAALNRRPQPAAAAVKSEDEAMPVRRVAAAAQESSPARTPVTH